MTFPVQKATKPRRARRAGFTLIEIMLAMLIVSILAGMGVVLFRGWKSQRALEDTMTGIESCGRIAYNGILQDQRPWMVVFEKRRCAAFNIGGLPPEDMPVPSPKYQIELEDDQVLLMKRTTWKDWKEIVVPEIWRFEPRAILEPIQVRIESKKGWIQGRFDPLTARLVDIEMQAD